MGNGFASARTGLARHPVSRTDDPDLQLLFGQDFFHGAVPDDPDDVDEGELWLNSDAGVLRMRVGGVNVDLLAISGGVGTIPWANVTGTPTTRDGYGITDVYLQTQVDTLLASVAATAASNLTAHEADTTNVHGFADTTLVPRLASIAGIAAGDTTYYNGTAWARLAIGTAGKMMRSTGSATSWTTATYPNTVAAGDLMVGSSTNVYGSLTIGAANTVLTSSGSAAQWSTSIAYAALPAGANGTWDVGSGFTLTLNRTTSFSGPTTFSRSGANVEIFKMNTDRPWSMYQRSTGATAALALASFNDSKSFTIQAGDSAGANLDNFVFATAYSSPTTSYFEIVSGTFRMAATTLITTGLALQNITGSTVTNNQNGTSGYSVVNTTDGTASLARTRYQSDINAAGSNRFFDFALYAESHATSLYAGAAALISTNVLKCIAHVARGTSVGDEVFVVALGSPVTYSIWAMKRATTDRKVVAFFTNNPSDQALDGGLFLASATAVPTGDPTGGTFLFVDTGVLKARNVGTGANQKVLLENGAYTLGATTLGAVTCTTIGCTTVTAAGNVLPDSTANNRDLGLTGQRFRHLFLNGNADIVGTLASGAITAAGHVKPSTDVAYNLGDATHRWSNLYCDNLFVSTDMVISGIFNAQGGDFNDAITVAGLVTADDLALAIATTGSTVGAAGAASAMPTPVSYLTLSINGSSRKIALFNV